MTPAFLPLRLVESHFLALEALWSHQRGEVFSTLAPESPLVAERARRRAARNLAALARNKEEAVRHALVELQSSSPGAAYTAARVLAALAPEACLDAQGRVRLQAPSQDAIVAALSDARLMDRPNVARFELSDPSGCEVASASATPPEAALWATLLRPDPTAGLALAARATPLPRWARAVLFRHAFEPVSANTDARGERTRGRALFALGAHFARRSVEDQRAFAALVDTTIGAAISSRAHPDSRALFAMSVVGHSATARRIADKIEREPTLDLLYALGMLGFPRDAPQLARLTELGRLPSPQQRAIATEAMRALYLMSGRRFETTKGREKVPDTAAAVAFADEWAALPFASTRHHLGVPLDQVPAEGAPPSFRWLHAVLTGAPRALAGAAPIGLIDDRPRRLSRFFAIDPPCHFERGQREVTS